MPAPTVTDATTYLGASSPYTEAEVTQALGTELAAQAARCRVPDDTADWPADLAEAALRRVQRNLAMRAMPLGYQTTTTEYGPIAQRVGSDPEIVRLEAPYRRWAVG